MSNKLSDTYTLRGQFQDLNFMLLKAIDSLSKVSDPNAKAALQDLRNIGNSIGNLHCGVSTHIHTGRHKLEALAEVGHVINSSLGLTRVLEEVVDSLIALVQAER